MLPPATRLREGARRSAAPRASRCLATSSSGFIFWAEADAPPPRSATNRSAQTFKPVTRSRLYLIFDPPKNLCGVARVAGEGAAAGAGGPDAGGAGRIPAPTPLRTTAVRVV